ncbi:MAG: precorrin-6A synthase (deacetylating) [Hyphomicrobiaceae bacterium]
MIALSLIGIGAGSPEHMTLGAVRALNAADLILIPLKGDAKSDLAQLRHTICAQVLTTNTVKLIEFELPVRDASGADYVAGVDDWHDRIAQAWSQQITTHLPHGGRVALLIWGDPSLFDSSLRIAGRLQPAPTIDVIPGITALQALCAAHAIPLNEIGEPVLVTTGRKLRERGWPVDADCVAVMLDGGGAFECLDPAGLDIWWGAYVGMDQQVLISGPLGQVAPRIITTRQAARASHGWIMDTYLLKRRHQVR